jgi:16S rRNA (guanine966-N2)-methyltransferase
VRVVAGSLRGRPITAPEGDATRPTTDRAREAVFNALNSLGAIEDANTLDLYAGSGALGIEAISRGAQRCTFVERDRRALEAIRSNVERLGISNRSSVLAGDVSTLLSGLRQMDLVLADPPYGFDDWDRLLAAVEPCLAPDALLVVESDREIEVGEVWEIVRSKRYGRAWVTFLRRSSTD